MSDPKTSATAYLSSGAAVIFGLSANELAAYIGAACAVATFVVNWYYKRQHLKLISRMPFPSLQKDEI